MDREEIPRKDLMERLQMKKADTFVENLLTLIEDFQKSV